MDLDARAVYAQLLAIVDDAREARRDLGTCSAKEVDGILEAYAAARSLCHEVTCGEKVPVSLPDLGRIADNGQYTADELRATLTLIEIECFKGIGALARIIALIPKKEARHE